MSSVVYWIRNEDHTDMFTQGYIGVSSQVEKRWEYHKKHGENNHLRNAIKLYGWDKLVKQVLLVSDLAYCLMIESQLRAEDKIGWNIVKGGGMPPITKWNLGKNLSETTKSKISNTKKGHKHKPEVEAKVTLNLLIHGINTRFKKGSKIHDVNVTCPHCDKTGLRAPMHRWHMDKCKFKENHLE